jgi:hypothetical protein
MKAPPFDFLGYHLLFPWVRGRHMKIAILVCAGVSLGVLPDYCVAHASRQAATAAGSLAVVSKRPSIKRGALSNWATTGDADVYAVTDAGDGEKCIVGVRTDEDGMNERPIAYLSHVGGKLQWRRPLPIPVNTFQGRATHCVASATAIFVLVQADTQLPQSLSQTVLQLFKLDRRNGSVIATRNVSVPNVSAAYTAWVEEAATNLFLQGSKLMVRGRYSLLLDSQAPAGEVALTFSAEVPLDLETTH